MKYDSTYERPHPFLTVGKFYLVQSSIQSRLDSRSYGRVVVQRERRECSLQSVFSIGLSKYQHQQYRHVWTAFHNGLASNAHDFMIFMLHVDIAGSCLFNYHGTPSHSKRTRHLRIDLRHVSVFSKFFWYSFFHIGSLITS